MTAKAHKVKKVIKHDCLAERKWLTLVSGFQDSSSAFYTIYRLIIQLATVYMSVITVYACLIEPSKPFIVRATHSLVLDAYYIFWFLTMRLVLFRSLKKMSSFLQSGVYQYEDEEEDEELMRMKKAMPKEIRRKSNIFVCMFYFAGITMTTLFPLSQLAFVDPEQVSGSELNPFLPHLYYQPFDTTTFTGTVLGWCMGVAIYFFMLTIECTVNWYYISGVVQMKIHFRILNYSITNIQRRALSMYTKKRNLPYGISSEQLLEDRDFQNCLYLSFRSNIEHHQALLRFRDLFEPFSGSFTLWIFTLAPIVFGCMLYLLSLYQHNPVNVTITLLMTFAAEQFTVIFICFLGEDVYTESEQLFHRLYSIDWFAYNKKFNQILHIMMSNTRKPTGVRALVFGVPASLETYGNVMSAMYKITNLVRQSDMS